MKKIDNVYQMLEELEGRMKRGISAFEISEVLHIDRTSVSRYLNRLYEEKKVEKFEGRPVLFRVMRGLEIPTKNSDSNNSLDKIIGSQSSLQVPIQQAKAAILYPPRGLHTLILGETGVGKSMFAELMYQFAKESGVIKEEAAFIRFNCADYAENPQLLISQIFGVKKGSYTGADRDREGLLKKAHEGILFLDEVHRLSPQGQEMLFTYIDKGCFKPLGETEKSVYADVQIIAATTEDPQSYLLNTFTRRIPMMITLPSLKERDLTERHYLIETFIKQESKRIGKSIYINKNSFVSFLLYDCPNNIGQLRSDIQLACAKAFANYKSKKEDYILISQSDLPQHVKKGMLQIHRYRDEMDLLLKRKGDILRFYFKENSNQNSLDIYRDREDFYDIIETKIESLKSAGIQEEEINQIINLDIESHFHKYIGNFSQNMRKNEVAKIVDVEVLEMVEMMLELAKNKLYREYDEKIYFGLALHIHGFMERVNKGTKIYHPKLNFIRVEYPDEFLVAMEIARYMDQRLGVQTPLDEIGYLTMFLATNPLDVVGEKEEKVGILVIMHGNSTASSMVDVCNALIGEEHAVALDMPLSMNPQAMYEIAKEKVIELDRGKGVLMMVDMGSLTNFGDMIYEETGVIVKTVDMVTTSLVIDACRKAVLGREIQDIYEVRSEVSAMARVNELRNDLEKKNLIITACFTGEGASERLKRILEEKVTLNEDTEIIPLNIINRREFMALLDQYKEMYRILAVVSTIDIHLKEIPFIPAMEILQGHGIQVMEQIIQEEQLFIGVSKSLKNHMTTADGETVAKEIRWVIDDIEKHLKVRIRNEVKIGIALHIGFLIDRLKAGGKEVVFRDLEAYSDQYSRELKFVKARIQPLEEKYKIEITKHDLAYICKMFLSNQDDLRE
ncbi:transcriptional regulatory protein LevR/transcriptional regulator with AAA-type ATPase domain [Anaerosolibacter carboniphilus]|uniref:Transcriptional regulatory protein LevR/transcriptional regulator with AAA-type ATPase domain n=1 Tax=Anaerosolibacter carboniphilus TaxID=1417629 RepID=A0A841KMA3_9FIRM|nr:sigma-54-dependent transcriptional regulator [Anaerosolibacter carboniphilus]MBB6214381.1 transcriptional regulatory protein LevR/transcriptional regulator with AAA-type ATPase domain [Anaerosolibacter carboniphilus]